MVDVPDLVAGVDGFLEESGGYEVQEFEDKEVVEVLDGHEHLVDEHYLGLGEGGEEGVLVDEGADEVDPELLA